MKKCRKLINELVQVGDIASISVPPEESAVFAHKGDACIGRNSNIPGWDNDLWYREVKQDNWIAFSDRKPTKEDTANGTDIPNLVLARRDGYVSFYNIDKSELNHGCSTHWMPLNFNPREPTRIKVDGHEVVPNKNGSLKVGCKTVSSQDFEEIVRQRNEAMK